MAHFPTLHDRYALYDAGTAEGLRVYRLSADAAPPRGAARTLGAQCRLSGEPVLDALGAAPIQPVPFVAADGQRMLASFQTRAELEAALSANGKIQITALRNAATVLRTAGASKKAAHEGSTVFIVSADNVANTITVLPEFPDGDPIEGTNAHKRVLQWGVLGGLKFHHFNPPAPIAPVVAGQATVAPVKHELRIVKDQILTKSGEMQYRLGYYCAVPIEEADELGQKCAKWAQARDRMADFSWSNPQLLFDPYWFPYVFAQGTNDELATKGLESGLRDFFSVQLNDETSTINAAASKAFAVKVTEGKEARPAGKAPYPFYREKIKLIVMEAAVLADLCRQKRPDVIVLKQVEAIQDGLGSVMRRRGFPIVHPSAKDSMTPIWFWRAEQRATGLEKRPREDFEL